MDMYYHLKERLECRDCKHPLKFARVGLIFNSYIASCAGCGQEYEVYLEVKCHNKEE